jgi:hypothetical protein
LRWQHVRVRANGQPAFGLYASRPGDARYLADAIIVLGFDSAARISSVTAFKQPAMFARFSLPPEITPSGEPR